MYIKLRKRFLFPSRKMAIMANRVRMGVKDINQGPANVPDNQYAQLSYYFYCICKTLDIDSDPTIDRLRDYNRYYNFSQADKAALLKICRELSPGELEGKLFNFDEAYPHDGNLSNTFLEFSVSSTRFAAGQGIFIFGQRRTAKRMMIYKSIWAEESYYKPLREINRQN